MMFAVMTPEQLAAGKPPTEEALLAMHAYNEELRKAGVLLDLGGLMPGVRMKFSGSKRTLIDGPFPEAKEMIAGYSPRVLAGLVADEAEVHGLVALLELSASRLAARIDRDGAPVLLADQDRARWDHVLVRRGLEALVRADELVATRGASPGPYHLQAAISGYHARAATAEATEWPRIAALYTLLAQRAPSPIVELNRAVAVAMAFGADAGLVLVDALVAERALAAYHLLPAVRGDLLAKLGRGGEASVEFRRAAELTRNERERVVLLERARDAAVSAARGT